MVFCFTIFVVKLLFFYSLSFNLKTPDQSSSLRYLEEFLIHDSHRLVTIGTEVLHFFSKNF
jgi:hypothetical protein